MIKLGWSMICRGTDEEAEMLDKCLGFLDGYVDGIFIAITNKKGEETNKKCIEVCEKHKAIWKPFEWIYDFSKARNFALSMVPKDYTHWGWCDADDGVRGIELLKETIEKNPDIDLFNVDYLFHFDKNKNTDVVHQKTMIAKNDGCVEWYRPLHEDFKETRSTTRKFIKGIERIHLATEEHFEESKKRNVEISKMAYEEHPEDPGYLWNYGQSLFGNGQWEDAKEIFLKFLQVSQSEEERYLVLIKLGNIYDSTGDIAKASDYYRMAIGLKPNYPDAYHAFGQSYFNRGQYQQAAEMITNGLVKKPPYRTIVVYNPRDYDFFPLMLLGKIFYALSRPDQALTAMEACAKIDPKNTEVQKILTELRKAKRFFDKVLKEITKIEKMAEKDQSKLPHLFNILSDDIKAHPGICALRNKYIIKKESSGRDLVYYCGFTTFPFNPIIAKKKGIGGSEEAVINLASEWKKLGWNVTIYCNTGDIGNEIDGIKYLPYWMWNYRDKQDVTIIWRQTQILDKVHINSSKIFIDVHDVMPEGEFTPERLAKIDKVMVKTEFHRSLFPNIPDEKIAIIPNGMDFELFNQKIKKDPYLIVNTSSPDRSMDITPYIFKKVKEQIPEAKMKWCYGFDLFDNVHSDNQIMMEWSAKVKQDMADAGIENLGRLSQKNCAKLYLEGSILLYPTEFAEIDCITVKKAQACGCLPITTDFGALKESVKTGILIPSQKTKNNWCLPNQFHFGVSDETQIQQFVDAIVNELKNPSTNEDIKEKMEDYRWEKIGLRWHNIII